MQITYIIIFRTELNNLLIAILYRLVGIVQTNHNWKQLDYLVL